MTEQQIAANAVLLSLIEDRKIKGSKRKKIDHWKSVACQSIGITRMGSARWNKILDYGYVSGLFKCETIGQSQKMVLTPLKDEIPSEITEDTETPETPVEETPAPIPVRLPHPNLNKGSNNPQPGDMYYYRSYQGGVVKGEVISSYTFVDVRNPDGTWQTVLAQDLYDNKRGIPSKGELTVYYSDNSDLKAERNRLLEEIKELKKTKMSLKTV